MPTLFFFDDPACPQPQAFARLREVWAATGASTPLQAPPDESALKAALAATPHAALLFSGRWPEADARAKSWRAQFPSLACVALIEQALDGETLAAPDVAFAMGSQTDILSADASPTEALVRIQAALRSSAALAASAEQIDPITGLYHQRPFMARLQEEISLARRHLSPFACLAIAIDGFAMYRDGYGYDVSQALLAHTARIICERKRQEDIAALIGDGEIALLLPRSSEKGCKPLATRILQSLSQTPFAGATPDGEAVCESLELHIGVVAYPSLAGDAPEEAADIHADALLRYARHALHQAKRRDEVERPVDRIAYFSEIQPTLG
ncbi:MAG: GGDEF domain-containing protein [Vampirovibrionales bacterium]|nr:GGDEF domain-containing protein [Vampirovibrionales bacterium]